ncbi:MAG: transposase [Culicoidibacterales bacterium]
MLTRKQTLTVKQNPQIYRFMPSNQIFDFDGDGDYTLNFRVVRFNISETTYESIITNLPEDPFSLDDIKTLYAMRWGLETAVRTLKYTVGLMTLHTKKVVFILQELSSKLLIFNLCQLVAFFDIT